MGSLENGNVSFSLVDKLEEQRALSKEEFETLIDGYSAELFEYISCKARRMTNSVYGNDIYVRGLIEYTNFCKNNCFYCGIRAGNQSAERYRLCKEEILHCCDIGYKLGFRTFVMQGGEDLFFSVNMTAEIISEIKDKYPDCALTLSMGEHSYDTYKSWFDAGADRYLLRHETADADHFSVLHPKNLSLENRINCLENLKKIGFQVGTGFMVGSPGQKTENLAKDLLFIQRLQPDMVGIGPFIPHKDTVFADEPAGTAEQTVFLLSVLRLMLPHALLPATTALGTIDSDGREKGILAGANVVMPNLSPKNVRKKYLLYDNKISVGDEAAESFKSLAERIEKIGYKVVVARGDVKRADDLN